MLQIRPTEDIHRTAQSYAAEIEKATKEWLSEFSTTVSAIVTDNEHAMRAGVRMAQHPSLACFVHTMQLCVQHGLNLPQVEVLLTKAKTLVKLFRHSRLRMDTLHEKSAQLNAPKLQVISWSKTRWGSLLMALRRLIELRLPISLITDDADISAARLTDAEWNSLGAICDVLRPIETCCTTVGGQKYTTLSTVLLLLDTVRAELNEAVPNETQIAKDLRHGIRDEVYTRFKLTGTEAELHVLAMMLDPRFRNQRICMTFLGNPASAVDIWGRSKAKLIAKVSRCIKSNLDGIGVETSSQLPLPRVTLGPDKSNPFARLDRVR
jgi:hypothetical protein